ncbi:MAG: dienelactone hydrolase family protein [Bacteroidales bacterium]|nr:dienelactone hydrolase family protein [Bacteroidales bacterium]
MNIKNYLKGFNIKLLVLSLLMITIATADGYGRNQEKEQNAQSEKKNEQNIVRKKIDYKAGNTTLKGYLFYDENKTEKSPGIIVVHEWWGNNAYSEKRARMLAELGYTAFAADMYGNGLIVDNPEEAQKNAGVIYSDTDLLKERMTAAYDVLVNSGFADPERIAAIGYCFGGTVVLTAASLDIPLDAVVSFHGGLAGFKANPTIKNTHVLVCNGAADKFVSQEDKDNFKNQMKAAGADYEFKEYEGALHAFTNPESTEAGEKFNMPIAYNAAADSASWNDMMEFFSKYFPVN